MPIREDSILTYAERISKNRAENESFSKEVDSFTDNKMPHGKQLVLGDNPLLYQAIGSKAQLLVINQRDFANSINPETQTSRGHTKGHAIPIDFMKQLPEALRNPLLVIKGRYENTVTVLTQLKGKEDEKDKNVIVPITLDVRGNSCVVNRITTVYGKDDLKNLALKIVKDDSYWRIKKKQKSCSR